MTSVKIIPPKLLCFFMLLVSSSFLMNAQENENNQEYPIYPGCEKMKTNKSRKKCMSENINQFVLENFDYRLTKKLNLTEREVVYVKFVIETNGEIVEVDAKSLHQVLSDESERIVNLLPKMTPGKSEGKNIRVKYHLPIVLKAE
ncbi:MAG: energy transducer TonB [Bacteroidota bacterium]